MAINSNPRTHPVSWLIEQKGKGNLNTDISIQRQAVWSHLHQSNLIMAILHNVPISNLWLEKDKRSKYKVIDGKQRTLTLCSFIGDNFPLSPKMRYKKVETVSEAGKPLTVDVSGRKFSELESELQDRILQYQLSITIIDQMEPDERALVFYMGNQCVPLSNVHFLPVVLGEHIMEKFNEVCIHPFFTDKVKLTTAALQRRNDLKIIVQFLILKSDCDMGFAGSELITFCDMIRNGTEQVPYEEITKVLDYLNEAVIGKRDFLRPMHLPLVMDLARKAMDKDVDANSFGAKVDGFYTTPNEEFREACLHGSSKTESSSTSYPSQS